ncbi:uncharacterized protein METZ01_LOCUS329078 [marine metagenome]|uniref:Uncharacterized protein n=1 Tax=marine metagenome TaxID=408172 RepID=A0A382PSB3_9ZZZZ
MHTRRRIKAIHESGNQAGGEGISRTRPIDDIHGESFDTGHICFVGDNSARFSHGNDRRATTRLAQSLRLAHGIRLARKLPSLVIVWREEIDLRQHR